MSSWSLESFTLMPASPTYNGYTTVNGNANQGTPGSLFDDSFPTMPSVDLGDYWSQPAATSQPKEELTEERAKVKRAAQEHMNIVATDTNDHNTIRESIKTEMEAIFDEYSDDPDTRDAVVAEFIKLVDMQQGYFGKDANQTMSMNDSKISDYIIELYKDEPARLFAVLNNSVIDADPDNKASVESGEWAEWGLNRKLRYALIEGKNGSASIKDMNNIDIFVQRIIQEEDPDKMLEDLRALARFVRNSGTTERDNKQYQIKIAGVRNIINKIDSSILTEEQKEELRSILSGTN